eukprot:CAMPEP_0176414506 /NCGR_PEP_ID=MMETSP0127-20121128/5292_1 /TAXON_ID=938130 /ORGANISM="Platyophrya macrostoma, Strain WH" /LENGTH=32 /DNA_ID= /DNA_START= /DNA_END= /DNA_ORIENTATION=
MRILRSAGEHRQPPSAWFDGGGEIPGELELAR